MKKTDEYLAKLQRTAWLSHALCAPGQHTAKRRRRCSRQSRSCSWVRGLALLAHPVHAKQSEPNITTTPTPRYWIFTGRVLFPTLYQHCQSTEGTYSYLSILLLKTQWRVYIRLTWQQWWHRVAVASEWISLYPALYKSVYYYYY